MPGDIDVLRALVGAALFVAPGVTWTAALTPGLPWAYRVPIALVVAFTVPPGVLFVLHLVLQVPLTLATYTFAAAALTLVGLWLALGRHAPSWDLDRLGERDDAAVDEPARR